MKLIWLLLLVAGLFAANRWWNDRAAVAPSPRTAGTAGQMQTGNSVRQLGRAPTDVMDMAGSMPGAGGSSSAAMLDAARGAR
jgi:hypothetical protein